MSTDWTKPVYHTSNGAELFALRTPDGHVFVDANGRVMAVNRRNKNSAWLEKDTPLVTNTPPRQDWERVAILGGPEDCPRVKTLYGIRNGKPFAEVVE